MNSLKKEAVFYQPLFFITPSLVVTKRLNPFNPTEYIN